MLFLLVPCGYIIINTKIPKQMTETLVHKLPNPSRESPWKLVELCVTTEHGAPWSPLFVLELVDPRAAVSHETLQDSKPRPGLFGWLWAPRGPHWDPAHIKFMSEGSYVIPPHLKSLSMNRSDFLSQQIGATM